MFTFETVVDNGAKTAKQFAGYVQDEKIKKELVSLVDLQADFYKSIYNSTLDITKTMVDTYAKVDLTKFTTAKAGK